MKSCFALSLSISFFFIKTFGIEAAPSYLHYYCPNTTAFAPNSAYQSNLDTLLSSLSSAATNSGFANATAGQSPPDKAYGLFLCRGDLNTTTCNNCVATGKQEILQRCPNQEMPAYVIYDPGNISEPTEFVQVLGQTIKDVASRASIGNSVKKFAVAEKVVMSNQTLYTLAQCTPDLTQWDCNTCLRWVIPNLPEGKQGGRIFTPSCILRFQLSPFYNNASPVAVPLAPPAATPEEPRLPLPVIITDGKAANLL